MKILVMDMTAKIFSLECESTDTIAHLKAKLLKQNSLEWISLCEQSLMFDGKLLGDEFSENMTLADVGVQDGSLILESYCDEYRSCPKLERPRRRPEKDYLYYADAFKSGWREEHAKALLHLLLELCQDGTISEGNVTDEAWLRIQNSLKNSMKCSFQIDFLKERLHDYKQLYSVLAETTSSSVFEWDRERKIITIDDPFYNWREEYPELLLLCGPHIPYFDTLEEVCLLVNTTRSFEQRVSETSQEASSSRGEIGIRRPSDTNFSPVGSSTSIEKENGYLSSTMKILVVDGTAKVVSLECESTDTIAHLKEKLEEIKGISSFDLRLMFDGKLLGDEFSENMMLADVGVQDGSFILEMRIVYKIYAIIERPRIPRQIPRSPRQIPGWREEHAEELLHLLLELCQDGTISEGNVTDEAWLRIQINLNNSMKCSFQIDFLKNLWCVYKHLYLVLAETTCSSIFEWDRKRKIIIIYDDDDWREEFPHLSFLCGPYIPYIPYFDTLEKLITEYQI